jgi:TonB family protein
MRRAAVALLVPALLTAQDRALPCRPPHTPDSLLVAITAAVRPIDTTRLLPDRFEGFFLQELKNRLRLPQPFVLGMYSAPDTLNGVPNVPRRALAVLHALFGVSVLDGTAQPRVLESSGIPAFDRAVFDAIVAISAEQAVPPLPDEWRGRRMAVRLRIETESGQTENAVLFRLQVPVFPLSREVEFLSGPRSGFGFPEELRKAGIEGSALLQYAVDVTGRPLEGSFRVIKTDHNLFAREALEVLPKMRFSPARIGDCAVPVIVRQPFNFNLRP